MTLPLQGSKQLSREPLFPGELPTCPYVETSAHMGPFQNPLPYRGEEGARLGKAGQFLKVIVSFPFQTMVPKELPPCPLFSRLTPG